MGNNLKKKLAAEAHNMELERRKNEARLREQRHVEWVAERKASRVATLGKPGVSRTLLMSTALAIAVGSSS